MLVRAKYAVYAIFFFLTNVVRIKGWGGRGRERQVVLELGGRKKVRDKFKWCKR